MGLDVKFFIVQEAQFEAGGTKFKLHPSIRTIFVIKHDSWWLRLTAETDELLAILETEVCFRIWIHGPLLGIPLIGEDNVRENGWSDVTDQDFLAVLIIFVNSSELKGKCDKLL